MKPIISHVDKELILSELSQLEKVRDTHYGGNEIYVFDALHSPNLMREVARLREEAFRSGGGGTGEELDIDEDDTASDGYHQLIAWSPKDQEIIGGYRYIISHEKHPHHMSPEHYFKFSELFREDYLPYTIELGRAFVQLKYQASGDSRSIYALDNLWDGIGALIALHPEAKYLLGKVTMYSSYNEEARNMLFYFLQKYFPDRQHLIEGIHPLEMNIDTETAKQKADKANLLNQIQALESQYPDVDINQLPDEVIAMAAQGETLLSAYRAYELKQLREQISNQTNEINALKKNQSNKQKSTGRLSGKGGNDEMDAFLDGFNS